jgi:hypothetical protein
MTPILKADAAILKRTERHEELEDGVMQWLSEEFSEK